MLSISKLKEHQDLSHRKITIIKKCECDSGRYGGVVEMDRSQSKTSGWLKAGDLAVNA